MNVKGLLELELPIPFYDICTIYPINIETLLLKSGDSKFNQLFTPYVLSKDDFGIDIFDFLLNQPEYKQLFIESIKLLIREDNVLTLKDMLIQYLKDKNSYADLLEKMFKEYSDINKFIDDKNCIVINENKFVTKSNFEEFVNIVRTVQEIHPPKKEEEPKFKSEEGRKRWLELKKSREEFKKNDNSMSLENIINVVQFGKDSYIPSDQIRKWSMWKLINAYTSILSKDGYDKSFSATTSGFGSTDKEALKKHWSELLKVT